MSVLLRIAYDGTDFHGFARQPGVRTVQGELETALSTLYHCAIATRVASRTDAGVHARGQIVAFDPPFAIPSYGLQKALGGLLPNDVVVWRSWSEASKCGAPIEPRFRNEGKHYRYRIDCAPDRNPLSVRYVWHVRRRLDVERMRMAAASIVGEHDFSAFRAADCQAANAIRIIEDLKLTVCARDELYLDGPAHPQSRYPRVEVRVDIWGTAFLKNMVRILVGTLVEVGLRKKDPAWIDHVLAARNRGNAGPTAPACGLTLM